MTEYTISRGGVDIYCKVEGSGAPVVFANSLGTDMRLWDPVLPLLPDGLQIIRFDKRGHGKSSVPPAPYTMGALVSDAEAVMDHLGVKDAVFVGLSIGGMIAQGLAVKRLDLIRAVVLSNTAAKIGTKEMWQTRIDAIRQNGLASLTDTVMERWFGTDFLASPEMAHWRAIFEQTPEEGYIGCSQAIAGTDFYSSTSTLRCPVLGIAGTEDGSTPPDLMRETLNVIPGSEFHLMQRCGHLPCVEKPQEYAARLTQFLKDTGHV
ncbi:3-oxoadipate enol-lactonase [Algirhabdus cladophorae]|uniref:3-oxoadipate enol-lactonase n=1 Tax=Algirhabdus cladophorae TaxID=3377108 RepID=UPI003B8460DC